MAVTRGEPTTAMSLLPAHVPSAVARRAELVPARLARNVAPLFGVAWDGNPFGAITWLCDFNRITLAEIARGAPAATRAERAAAAPAGGTADWHLVRRAVEPGDRPLPNQIVNATMNRYGPHTKSAVMLTAANALFAPIRAALAEALPLLCDRDGAVHPAHAVIGWATVVIEVFRSQPALAIAAFKARAIQRTLLGTPHFQPGAGLRGVPLARAEIGADEEPAGNDATHPRDLAVVDTGLVAGPDDASGHLAYLRPQLADQLVKLLLAAAEPDGAGYVWIARYGEHRLTAEALLPSDALVSSLMSWLHATHAHVAEQLTDAPSRLHLPGRTEFRTFPPLVRTVLVLAAIGVVRQHRAMVGGAFSLDDLADEVRAASGLAGELDDGDPVALAAAWRLAVLTLDIELQRGTGDVRKAVSGLLRQVDRGLAGHAAGELDPGLVADLISASCRHLNAARAYGGPPRLDQRIHALWGRFAGVLEIDLGKLELGEHRALGYHLHNYASYLGAHDDSEADLRESLRLFTEFVLPFRAELDARTGEPIPSGRAKYLAARSGTRLARLLIANGEHDEARELLTGAVRHVEDVLDVPAFQGLIAYPAPDTIPFGLIAADCLLTAAEQGVAPQSARTRADALTAAVAAAMRDIAGEETRHPRYTELAALRQRR